MGASFWARVEITMGTLVLVMGSFLPSVDSANILYVAFISVESHKITYEPLLEALAARGHQVTELSPHASSRHVPNLTRILTMDVKELLDKHNPDYRLLEKKPGYDNPRRPSDLIGLGCNLTYDLPQVQAVLQQRYDLVLLPPMVNSCAAGFIYKLNTSLVLLSLVQGTEWVLSPVGGVLNTASTDSSFWHRLKNIWTKIVFSYYDSAHKEMSAKLYRDKLGDPTLPSVNTILANASLVLSSGHFSLNTPRQYFPDVVDVGALHCHSPKPLPAELEKVVLDSEPDGFLLCSFGSGLSGSSISKGKLDIFLTVFGKLKETVIWKWEGEHPPNLPKNVKLFSWVPQQDLLGHPKIKGFITQGGHLAITEALFHGCQMLGLPIVSDQFVNLEQAERLGTALVLDFHSLTSERLLDGILEILTNHSYKENAKKRSRLVQDQPLTPLETAIFWTEYVIRHGGAPHLRPTARDLNLVELNSLDILCLAFTLFLLCCYATITLINRIIHRLCLDRKNTEVKRHKVKGS